MSVSSIKKIQSLQKTRTIVEPRMGWGILNLRELLNYRELIVTMVARNVKTRYRQQAFGPLWLFITPFVSMIVQSVIFGTVAKIPSDGFPYPIFLYAGVLPWSFFSTVYNGAMNSLNSFSAYMSKIYFPRLVAPIVTIATSLVDWSIQLILLILLLYYYRIPLTPAILMLPLYLLVATIVGAAVGLWAAALTVRFRDLPNIFGYAMMLWYYSTPVFYSAKLIPPQWEWLYQLNPMYWVIEGFRWALLGAGHPPALMMVLPVLIFIPLLILSLYIFERTSRNIVDYQ